jgi:hypothetical protein
VLPREREFLLTTDRSRVQRAIAEARKRAKQGETTWPREQLLWELHPVMQWLLDKVMCRFQRHEAPVIITPRLGNGRVAYLFQGVLSNRRSQPVVVEWFAVHLRPGQAMAIGPFEQLLTETGFDRGIANPGQTPSLVELSRSSLAEAVRAATGHMQQLGAERSGRLRQRVVEDRQRFEVWLERSIEQIEEDRISYQAAYGGRVPRDKQERLQRRRSGVVRRKQKREQWLSDTFEVVGTPYLRLAAVFVGE